MKFTSAHYAGMGGALLLMLGHLALLNGADDGETGERSAAPVVLDQISVREPKDEGDPKSLTNWLQLLGGEALPASIDGEAEVNDSRVTEVQLELTAIGFRGDQPVIRITEKLDQAISLRTYGVGDTVAGYRITAIARDRLHLERNGQHHELRIFKPITLSYENNEQN